MFSVPPIVLLHDQHRGSGHYLFLPPCGLPSLHTAESSFCVTASSRQKTLGGTLSSCPVYKTKGDWGLGGALQIGGP